MTFKSAMAWIGGQSEGGNRDGAMRNRTRANARARAARARSLFDAATITIECRTMKRPRLVSAMAAVTERAVPAASSTALDADPLAEVLASLSLRTTTAPVLAFDALNYLGEFLDLTLMRTHPWKAVRALVARVAAFVTAALRAGFQLIAVVDASTTSDEAGSKWRMRRARELRTEERNIILAAVPAQPCTEASADAQRLQDVILTDSLRENGIPVVRPFNADADDVLAALGSGPAGESPCDSVLWTRSRLHPSRRGRIVS